ncbi:MAG TPA: alpha/beta hydrolase, partial [Candidatus Nanoarchaeia archaeon]|nr:alpha/beta hydrolase [Candidatus Nanoarchaeia archaeon]
RSDVGWLLWLQQESKKKGFEAHGLNMPDTMNPTVAGWIGAIKKAVGTVDEDTYFVGHSLGCISICKFLAQQNKKAGGVVLVAGFKELKVPELMEFGKDPIDFESLNKKIKHRVTVASDDDPRVSAVRTHQFAEALGAKEIIVKGYGHFQSCPTLPIVLDELLKIS